MLKVSRQPSGEPEIFHSIQGEGVNAGTPAVFLRLALCNLTCTWCDTKYTWDWDNYEIKKELISLSEKEVIGRILRFNRPHLIITGGEPMLQQKELAVLTTSLIHQGFYCELETNGTISPSPTMINNISQWNVSPKTTGSGNKRGKREVTRAINAFRELNNVYFKFVIESREDIKEVTQLVNSYDISSNRVILMPEGTTSQILQERGKWIADVCKEQGYLFSTRLHIMLWGDNRGR